MTEETTPQQKWADPDMFSTSVADAGKQNNLASQQTVVDILKVIVGNVFNNAEDKTPEELLKIVHDQSVEFAHIMLGKSSNYIPMPAWNEPGKIDQFLAKWIGSTETDPENILEHFLVMFLQDLMDLDTYANQPETLDEQANWQVSAIFQRYSYLLIGVDPPTQAMLDLRPTNTTLTDTEEEQNEQPGQG